MLIFLHVFVHNFCNSVFLMFYYDTVKLVIRALSKYPLCAQYIPESTLHVSTLTLTDFIEGQRADNLSPYNILYLYICKTHTA